VLNGSTDLFDVLFDKSYVQSDAATLFFRLMQTIKPWYEINPDERDKNYVFSKTNQKKIPVVLSCNNILNILQYIDPELFNHFIYHKIEPQIFGLRWLRLLYSREIEFPNLLKLWDGIFSYMPKHNLIEWVAIALLKNIRMECILSCNQ
jgi:hypothetical protein